MLIMKASEALYTLWVRYFCLVKGHVVADIHFGTDGWRAIIGQDFTNDNLVRVVEAAGRAFKEEAQKIGLPKNALLTLIVGHDCRLNAHAYAQLAAQVVASLGFNVKLSCDYCPTPALCWSVAQDRQAIGGIMLTSSHNAAEYLGVKLRMADGGAAGKEFTDRVEDLLSSTPTDARGYYEEVDIMTPYLDNLGDFVNGSRIRDAHLHVVVDPLYGSGRGYLAGLLRSFGVEVCEIHQSADPTFEGLHPEPIPPWINGCLQEVPKQGFDAGFITDGDADRIGAVDERGNFVNPHRIMALITAHLCEDKGMTGRVVSTVTSSALLARQCKRLGLPLTTTPVGFKWIYAEMEKGDVLFGGEESGGMGIPSHVMERDGLLMALLLCETMAQRSMSLGELVDDLFQKVGRLEFEREGVSLTKDQMSTFRKTIMPLYNPEKMGRKKVLSIDRRDGVKLCLEDDAWVMMRPSGTEPLVRIYAEAETSEEVHRLLQQAKQVAMGQRWYERG